MVLSNSLNSSNIATRIPRQWHHSFTGHIQKMKVPLYHRLTPVPVLQRWTYHIVRLLSSAWRRYLVKTLKQEE
uniref:Alternative protein NAV3 n=1 Tax=Homo sapiens TaxID=9606 RepID=L8ECF3_HUMAN|nr:alternative protein NAV3 [Homo sapiens]